MLTLQKGDEYDYFKEQMKNELFKKMLKNNPNEAINYINSFSSDHTTVTSHGSHSMVHFFAKLGNFEQIKAIHENEQIRRKEDSLFMTLDPTGRNATYVALVENHSEIVRFLVLKGYQAIGPKQEILKMYFNALAKDNVKAFKNLYFNGLSKLEEYTTYEGNTLLHLVNFPYNWA